MKKQQNSLYRKKKNATFVLMKIKDSFRLLIGDVISFVKEDFHPWAYLYAAVVVTVLMVMAYACDGYQRWIVPMYGASPYGLYFAIYYACIYFLIAIPNQLIRKEYAPLKDWRFYLKPLFFITLMATAIGYTEYRQWFNSDSLTRLDSYFLRYSWVFVDGIFLVVVPLAIYKYLFDRKVEGVYGLCRRTGHINVYLLALLCLLPFVAAASFLPDFQAYYPRFHPGRWEGALGWPMWGITAFFETCYGLDFLTTEVFFRGAMVIGLTAIMGPRAVLPMCIFYCTVHFGKPMLESASAIFGGYLLGILAYKTKHIWGGVCAHLGIAFMMEIMGLIHLLS